MVTEFAAQCPTSCTLDLGALSAIFYSYFVPWVATLDISGWHFLDVCTLYDISTFKNCEGEIYNLLPQ